MTSGTASPDTGSPGPSIRYEGFIYENRHPGKFEGPPTNAETDRLRRELDDARQRIDRDTGVINSLHEKVTELEELVKKQKITISTQSRAISDRRVLRKNQQQSQSQSQSQSPMGMGMFPMTPTNHQHHTHQCQYPGSGASGIACCGTSIGTGGGVCMIQNTSPPLETQTQAQTPQSVKSPESASKCSTIFDQPPPKFEIPFGALYPAYTPVIHPGLSPGLGREKDVFGAMGSTCTSTPSPLFSGTSDYRKQMADFSTRFLALMRRSEIFGQAHASLPNIFVDSHLDEDVKDYLMAISSRAQASVLVGNAATRGFFVAKAINWYLVEKILKITVIKGFDASVDLEISEIQKQMTSDTPILVRHLMLTAMATHVTTFSKSPNFGEFTHQKIHYHLSKLWKYIGPLGHDSTNQNGSMWIDLNTIIAEALFLAIDMYSVPLEYRFEFPEPSEPFDTSTMINRDPYALGDPLVLQNSDARVRLGITPIVRVRNNSQSPGSVNLMYLGHVLLKAPRKKMP
ncbi:hypothetical protein BDW62DRAFT_216029 [Aspergillus aurantiobrunneus]